MKPGSHWSHIARSVLVFVIVAVVAGAIFYFNGSGPHHTRANLVVAIVAGFLAGAANYLRMRVRRAGRDPIYNAGRQLRDVIDDQRGEGGRPLPPGEAPRVVEPEPRRRG